jgi:hypothetical protein
MGKRCKTESANVPKINLILITGHVTVPTMMITMISCVPVVAGAHGTEILAHVLAIRDMFLTEKNVCAPTGLNMEFRHLMNHMSTVLADKAAAIGMKQLAVARALMANA